MTMAKSKDGIVLFHDSVSRTPTGWAYNCRVVVSEIFSWWQWESNYNPVQCSDIVWDYGNSFKVYWGGRPACPKLSCRMWLVCIWCRFQMRGAVACQWLLGSLVASISSWVSLSCTYICRRIQVPSLIVLVSNRHHHPNRRHCPQGTRALVFP